MLTTILLSLAVGVAVLAILYKPKNSKRDNNPLKEQTADEIPDYTGVKRVTDPKEVMTVVQAKTGVGAAPKETVLGLLQKAREVSGDKMALWHQDLKGNTRTWTWDELYMESAAFAKACIAAGLKHGEITNIIGFNSPEWFFAEYGTMLCGAIPAGVYTTSNPGSMAYIAGHAKARILICESKKYLERYVQVKKELSTVQLAVVWTAMPESELADMQKQLAPIKLLTWQQFLDAGKAVKDTDLWARSKAVSPGSIASLIYTSGTTGNPKAVMCCHDAMCFEARSLMESVKNSGSRPGFFKKNFSIVSFLPLNHAAAKVLDILGPLYFTSAYSHLGIHATTYIARPDAMKGTLTDTLKAAKPTMFFGVPRVWEKIQEKMLAAGKKTPFPLNKLSAYGKSLGRTWFKNLQHDGSGDVPMLWPLFNGILFNLVRKKLGLDNCEYFATGAAPIKEDTLNYFGSIGIPIMNAYGMSENMGACSLNIYNNFALGSAGYPLRGFHVKIAHDKSRDKPGHGEILIGGRGNMTGYMYNVQKTKETIDAEGYVHSGDIGTIKDGCVFITGRIKELIIGAGGENIAPVPIEHYIGTLRPAISNICMIGNERKFNTCLISLKTHVDPDTGVPSSNLAGAAKAVDPDCHTVEEAMKSAKWKEYLESGIKNYNNNHDVCVSRASRIQYFKILPRDLNVPEGTLGPTLKVKRPVVEKTYHDLIESMYTK